MNHTHVILNVYCTSKESLRKIADDPIYHRIIDIEWNTVKSLKRMLALEKPV